MDAIKRILLWDYPRASWQYDIIVGLILAFVFVTPFFVSFGDRPKAAAVAMVNGGYFIESSKLENVPTNLQAERASSIVNAKYKGHVEITNVAPIYDDAEQELKGYLAYPKQ